MICWSCAAVELIKAMAAWPRPPPRLLSVRYKPLFGWEWEICSSCINIQVCCKDLVHSYCSSCQTSFEKVPLLLPSWVVFPCVRDGSQGKRTIIAFRPFKDISLSLPDWAKTGNGDAKVMKGPNRDGEKAQTEIDPCAPSLTALFPKQHQSDPQSTWDGWFWLAVFFIVAGSIVGCYGRRIRAQLGISKNIKCMSTRELF